MAASGRFDFAKPPQAVLPGALGGQEKVNKTGVLKKWFSWKSTQASVCGTSSTASSHAEGERFRLGALLLAELGVEDLEGSRAREGAGLGEGAGEEAGRARALGVVTWLSLAAASAACSFFESSAKACSGNMKQNSN